MTSFSQEAQVGSLHQEVPQQWMLFGMVRSTSLSSLPQA